MEKQNSFLNLENIMLVLDSDVSRIFRELKYMLSKREIKLLSNDEKCDLIETSYIGIYKQLSIYLHELFYSPIFISESESKEISQYEEIQDKLFMWLENVYGRFVDFFEKEYTHDDHVRVFYDVEKLLESLQDEIKDFRQTVNGNDHSKRFSGDPKNNLNILLGNNTNFPEDDTKWLSTETNQQPDDCSRKSKSNVIHLPLQQSTVEENDSSDNKQIIKVSSRNETDCDVSVDKQLNIYRSKALRLIDLNNEFAFPLWQEKPFDLVIESFLRSWIDQIYFDQSDPNNMQLFKHVKEYFLHKQGENK